VSKLKQRLGAWMALSRLPFHSVGVLPFILGAILAWQQAGTFHWNILAWGTAGVVFVMLATYYAGEYWDHVEDALSTELGPSRFAGGSGGLPAWPEHCLSLLLDRDHFQTRNLVGSDARSCISGCLPDLPGKTRDSW